MFGDERKMAKMFGESGKCCVSGGVVLIYMYINLTKAHFQMEFGTEPKFEQRFAVRLHG